MSLPRLSLCTAAVLLALSTLNAQSVTTTPVGAVTTSLPVGYSMVGLTLLNPASATGVVSSNSASQITFSGNTTVGSALDAASFYYLEITNGNYEGDRFEIDVSATKAATDGTIVLNTASNTNTVALTSNALTGSSAVIRKHITLTSLQQQVSPALTGNNNSDNADQVQIFDRQSNAFAVYFLRGDGTTWRKFGETNSVGTSTIIPPGTGVFIKKAAASGTLTQVGEVRNNAFALPLSSGFALVSAGYPVGYSPTALSANATNGWTGNNSSDSADQIQTYNAAENKYNIYFLRGDGTTWRIFGDTTDYKNTQIVNHDSAFWVRKIASDINFTTPRPF